MGTQRLSNKKIRKLRKTTGLDITRAWAHGGYEYDFITRDHVHWLFNIKTKEWKMNNGINVIHYDSCYVRILLDEVPEWKENE